MSKTYTVIACWNVEADSPVEAIRQVASEDGLEGLGSMVLEVAEGEYGYDCFLEAGKSVTIDMLEAE